MKSTHKAFRLSLPAFLTIPFFTLVSSALADIKFESTMMKTRTSHDDAPVAIVYPFDNTGSTPVSIARIKVSCGCMSARQDAKVYQPGESGAVHVWFNPAGRDGVQKRTVSVYTLEGNKQKKHLLGLEVTIE